MFFKRKKDLRGFTIALLLKPHSQDTGCTIMDDFMTEGKCCVSHSDTNRESSSSAEWLECATCPCNKQTLCKCHTDKNPDRTRNSHTAGNIHLISNTPPRCGANRHSATRFEISNRSGVSDVMSVHPYVPHTRCSIEFRGCTLQRSFDDWPTCGLIPCRASDPFVHLTCTTGCPTTLHGL